MKTNKKQLVSLDSISKQRALFYSEQGREISQRNFTSIMNNSSITPTEIYPTLFHKATKYAKQILEGETEPNIVAMCVLANALNINVERLFKENLTDKSFAKDKLQENFFAIKIRDFALLSIEQASDFIYFIINELFTDNKTAFFLAISATHLRKVVIEKNQLKPIIIFKILACLGFYDESNRELLEELLIEAGLESCIIQREKTPIIFGDSGLQKATVSNSAPSSSNYENTSTSLEAEAMLLGKDKLPEVNINRLDWVKNKLGNFSYQSYTVNSYDGDGLYIIEIDGYKKLAFIEHLPFNEFTMTFQEAPEKPFQIKKEMFKFKEKILKLSLNLA